MPEISIIVPCYNQEKYIEECFASILSQTFQDYEVIVVNDGSTDNSLNVINKYIEKYDNFKLLNQANKGVVAARNNAIAQAIGKYIFPLDGDDKIAPDCLRKLHDAILNSKGDVIYCGGEYFGNREGRLDDIAATKFNMCLCNRVCVSALYHKDDWVRYGGYDEIMKQGLEDWEFWLNFIEDNKSFYKIDEALFFYRIVNASRNQSVSKSKGKELVKIIRKKHKKLFGWKFKIKLLFFKLMRFFYRKKVTKSGQVCIKICAIPLSVKFLQLLNGEKNNG